MENTLVVKRATPEHINDVIDFYTHMIDEMKGTNFDILWKHDVHPSHAFLRESVDKGYCFVGLAPDGEIACSLVIDRTAAPGYENVPWKVQKGTDEIGIVHSVATRPAYHGKGFAKKLFTEAFGYAREDGLAALRLDTFVDNVRSHGLYDSLGFINHGPHKIFYNDLGDIELDMFEYIL